MEGRRENSLPIQTTPTNDFNVRALDGEGKSCMIPFSKFQTTSPAENEIKDFFADGKIIKKRYTGGAWIDTGIEWET